MAKSTVLMSPKDEWKDMQALLADKGYTLGYKNGGGGRKASSDGGTTWTHTYTRSEMGQRVMQALRDDVGKAVMDPADRKKTKLTKEKADKCRNLQCRDRREDIDVKALGGLRQHAEAALAAAGLVNWFDPDATVE